MFLAIFQGVLFSLGQNSAALAANKEMMEKPAGMRIKQESTNLQNMYLSSAGGLL